MQIGPTKQHILDLLQKQRLSPRDLQREIGISVSVVHAHLKSLLEAGLIQKFGTAPRVFYKIRQRSAADVVEESFVFQDSLGILHTGMDGFRLWSQRGLKKFSFEEKVSLYAERVSVMESNRHAGVFDLTGKLQKIVAVGGEIHLQEMVALSLRTVRDFSRTRMGIYMDMVKSGGNQEIVDKILDYAVPLIIAYAKRQQVNAVGFIPPTRERSQQIMTLLEKRFRKGPLRLAVLDIQKVRTNGFVREQKSIKDLKDRIYNADHTFLISSYSYPHNYKRILLVDDFVGSGSTLNQVANILKERGFEGKVFGLGVVGDELGYSVEKVS
ncbi:MAG: winged helix-turn-helix transcriptional regulator [Candidatus Kaiserbacteria bacterium]|nr:winged helix-turn-helix transcriptional regulator [Candidatus Kaiserbacteria bacterium]